MQDQGPTSGTDVPSQLHVVSTAPDTKNIPGQKKKGENLRTAKGLFIIFALQIAATL